MKQLFIPLFFLFLIFGISNVYSQELDNTLFVVINEDEPIIISSQGEYDIDPDASSQIFTFGEQITETFDVKFPKSLPVMIQFEDGMAYPNDKFILADGEEIIYSHNETDCFFNYSIPVNNVTSIEIISAFIPEWEIKSMIVEHEPYCSDIFESLKQVKEFRTCENFHSPVFNSKVEQVCVYPESISKLTDRGYLI